VTEQPIYADVAKDLADDPLADCPQPGPIDPQREPGLFDAVPLPALAAPDEPEVCRGCGDTPPHLSSDGHCDGCVADGQDQVATS
jgi:hypothetical protein